MASKLFEPFRLGGMQLKNRIVMAPMGTFYGGNDGYMDQRAIDYYEARAKGQAGLIIVEGSAPGIRCSVGRQLTLGYDHAVESWGKLAEAVHRHGAKIAVQLMHAGWEIRDGKPVQVSPSAHACPARSIGTPDKPPLELTVSEIEEVVQWFAEAAGRAKNAGFDGVEIHGAHHYLVSSFLSSASNVRNDLYGGSIENKARFPMEILQAVRKTVGPDFLVWIRINAREYNVEDGVTIEETKRVVPLLVKAGAQAIHVSAFGAGSAKLRSPFSTKAPLPDTPGIFLPLAEEVKKITNVPVIAVGRLDMNLGEKALTEGNADLIAFGRRLIADPDLPSKILNGRLDDVRPCIGCLSCIEKMGLNENGMACAINPTAGMEKQYQIEKTSNIKKVAVIGGGPAGMHAATVAALKGHQVTLFEKKSELGSLLGIAALPPNKSDILPWLDYLKLQLKKAGVHIKCGSDATEKDIEEMKPDAVIIATGGIPIIPDIQGLDENNAIMAQDVLAGNAATGQNIVILGGGLVGCETGHYLATKGKNVTIIEELKRMAGDMRPVVRGRLMEGLQEKHVTMLTRTKCSAVAPDGVTVTTEDNQKRNLPADTVVVAAGYRPNDILFKKLKDKVPELYCIGDSAQPQGIIEAVSDGYRTGLSV
ncbi:MAG: FAD-dependent oxidoreductase [Syntrophales bacterium]|jgi:2,4-dienoyl-CoA reductase-like NADH-dependent reductase (Old Yellow Enzyme family)/thioredoxin reductase|nr:FAD-dependent oxidoreductase [Syntrophales bacterium]MDY0045615.1 FAD-dependent oxidoreductase [Syntrophales bacterium]